LLEQAEPRTVIPALAGAHAQACVLGKHIIVVQSVARTIQLVQKVIRAEHFIICSPVPAPGQVIAAIIPGRPTICQTVTVLDTKRLGIVIECKSLNNKAG
jgi:hypothetical protein